MLFGWHIVPLSFAIVPDGVGGHTVLDLLPFINEWQFWMEIIYDGQGERESRFVMKKSPL